MHRIAPRIDLYHHLDSERTRDDRPLRVLKRLLLGQLSALYELVDQRVVPRQADQLAVTEHVGAAVADVGDRDVGIVHIGRGQGGAHPRMLLGRVRQLVDLPVGLLDDDRQPVLGRPLLRQALLEGLDRDPRGDLARLRPAHPVGDDEHRWAGVGGILVPSPLTACVGPLRRLDRPEHHLWRVAMVIGNRRTRSRRF